MRFDAAISEDKRQAVHIAMGAFALALPYLPWWQLVLLASMAVLFNLLAIQKVLGLQVFRPGERLRRFTSGIVLYPLAVLGLLLVFPNRLDIVAAAWGILAAGDGMATIVGRRYPWRVLPWNPRKSVGGTVSMAAFGALGGSALAFWCSDTVIPPAYVWYPFVGTVTAAVVAAFVETLPIKLDDNVSVTAAAAGALWAISLVSEDAVAAAFAGFKSILPLAALTNIAVAAAGFRARTVTVSGAACGAVLGTIVLTCAGWAGWLLLLITFFVAVVTSRMGLQRKLRLGIAETRGGRRGPGNAIANTGVAAIAAFLSVASYAHEAALVAFTAALAAGGSDTAASEVGKAWGKRTFLVTTARPVSPGTPGAMSIEGTLAGLAGATLLAAVAVALGLMPWTGTFPVVAGATVGALAESAMGATLEPASVVNNDVLNFLNTAIAAWVALELWRLI